MVYSDRVERQALPQTRASVDIPSSNKSTESSNVNTNIDGSRMAWPRFEDSFSDFSASISQFSDRAPEPSAAVTSQTQCPPIQVMETPGTCDHNQKLVSFRSRSRSLKCSAVSNDSLFSLPVGIDSLPLDPALRMSDLLYKSGELLKSGELFNSEELFLSREFYLSGELYQSRELQKSDDLKMADRSKDTVSGEETSLCESFTDAPEGCSNSRSGKHLGESWDSSSANPHSNGSEVNNPPHSSSGDLCCWRDSCCCKWPTCCCFWRSCFCKCPTWLCCCFKWPSCKCCWP